MYIQCALPISLQVKVEIYYLSVWSPSPPWDMPKYVQMYTCTVNENKVLGYDMKSINLSTEIQLNSLITIGNYMDVYMIGMEWHT